MTTQVKAPAKGDNVLVILNSRYGGAKDFYEAKVTKVTPTGQLTIDAGMYPSGTPRVLRFKPKWSGYSEMGSTGSYRSEWYSLSFGAEMEHDRASVTRQRAINAGAGKVREKVEAITKLRTNDRVAMKKAAQELIDAIVASDLIDSLPEP